MPPGARSRSWLEVGLGLGVGVGLGLGLGSGLGGKSRSISASAASTSSRHGPLELPSRCHTSCSAFRYEMAQPATTSPAQPSGRGTLRTSATAKLTLAALVAARAAVIISSERSKALMLCTCGASSRASLPVPVPMSTTCSDASVLPATTLLSSASMLPAWSCRLHRVS